jgi:uncharacterized membrane protein
MAMDADDRAHSGLLDDVDEEEVAELVEDLEEVEDAVDSSDDRKTIRKTIRLLGVAAGKRVFGVDDLAQQLVGGFILSGPFVVTAEVWDLARGMNAVQTAITVFVVFAIGYGALFRAEDRDPDEERGVAGVPLRFVSLILVSYGSVTMLALVFDAPSTFGATPDVTVKAVCIGAIFSVVGAATADSIF